jgi:hypothetical protein
VERTAEDGPRVVHLSAASGLTDDWRWVGEARDRYDVLHWRDGVDGMSVRQARGLVDVLLDTGKPLVITVPPSAAAAAVSPGSQERVDAFSVLIPAAAALVVRDGESAQAVWRAWGRSCLVVPEGDEGEMAQRLYRAVMDQEPFAIDGQVLQPAAGVAGVPA